MAAALFCRFDLAPQLSNMKVFLYLEDFRRIYHPLRATIFIIAELDKVRPFKEVLGRK
jgi:hypothetical protein